MPKNTQIGLLLMTNMILGFSSISYAHSFSLKTEEQNHPAISSPLQGIEWVRYCMNLYPEILWLADENVRKTEEGQASSQGSYSEQLFGKKFIEFDRTIMTLNCLRLILNGNVDAYEEFTREQPKDIRLSRESFSKLHVQGTSLLKSNYRGMSECEILKAMEASLVLGDIGKSEVARQFFKPYGAQAPDHDDFHEEVIAILHTHPELCPTFHQLTSEAKILITQTANLIHYGHITHIEGGPSMFTKLKQSNLANSSPIVLSFDLFVHICDVAGALGHVNNQSSLTYTESSHLALQGVLESCKILASPFAKEIDAYNAYLAVRAPLLGLKSDDEIEHTLTRVGAMLRLFTPQDGSILKQAMQNISPELRRQIIEQFDIRKSSDLEHTPTYMPAVLINLSNNPLLGASNEQRIAQGVILGLPFLARVLHVHRQRLLHSQADPTIPLNFNRIAGIVKNTPEALNRDFYIDSEGLVCLSEY